MEKARKIEEENIDPVLEYEIKISRESHNPDQQ
jgi:hypothetical protein